MDNVGISFAPTTTNAQLGPKNGQLEGVPQAIQVLSMALPRVVGARSIAPQGVVSGSGGSGTGTDPAANAVLMSLLKALGIHSLGGLPGGTAGPNPPEINPDPSLPPVLPSLGTNVIPGGGPGGPGVPAPPVIPKTSIIPINNPPSPPPGLGSFFSGPHGFTR